MKYEELHMVMDGILADEHYSGYIKGLLTAAMLSEDPDFHAKLAEAGSYYTGKDAGEISSLLNAELTALKAQEA